MAAPVNLAHSGGECLHHIVFIPKYRQKQLYGPLRFKLGPVLRELAGQKGSIIHEGHLMSGHVHMLVQIPPESSVSGVVGCIKGKSAIRVARDWYGSSAISAASVSGPGGSM